MPYDAEAAAQAAAFNVKATEKEFYQKVKASITPAPVPRPTWWIDFDHMPIPASSAVSAKALKHLVFVAHHAELFEFVSCDLMIEGQRRRHLCPAVKVRVRSVRQVRTIRPPAPVPVAEEELQVPKIKSAILPKPVPKNDVPISKAKRAIQLSPIAEEDVQIPQPISKTQPAPIAQKEVRTAQPKSVIWPTRVTKKQGQNSKSESAIRKPAQRSSQNSAPRLTERQSIKLALEISAREV